MNRQTVRVRGLSVQKKHNSIIAIPISDRTRIHMHIILLNSVCQFDIDTNEKLKPQAHTQKKHFHSLHLFVYVPRLTRRRKTHVFKLVEKQTLEMFFFGYFKKGNNLSFRLSYCYFYIFILFSDPIVKLQWPQCLSYFAK